MVSIVHGSRLGLLVMGPFSPFAQPVSKKSNRENASSLYIGLLVRSCPNFTLLLRLPRRKVEAIYHQGRRQQNIVRGRELNQ